MVLNYPVMKRHELLPLVMERLEFEVQVSLKLWHYWGSDEVKILNEFGLNSEPLFVPDPTCK